jgi:hypothetical protein
MTCANFTDLNQKSDEPINDYTYHVQMAYKRLTDKKPATMAVVRAAAPTIQEAKAEGISDAFKCIKHQLFLAGLKDGICDKVLEAAKDTFTESVKVARNLETIQNDHKRLTHVAAIKAKLQDEKAREIIWDSLTNQELNQIAVICSHNKRFIHLKNDNQICSTFTMVRNPNVICRHCKKKGHLQKDCFSRKRDKAPIVDANGKVYQNNCINNVLDQPAAAAVAHPAEVAYEDTHIGSVTNVSPYHHLNW